MFLFFSVHIGRTGVHESVKLVFAPKYRDESSIESEWLDRSNPKSSNWGRWFSLDELVDRFAPLPQTVRTLQTALATAGASHIVRERKWFICLLSLLRFLVFDFIL